MQTLTSDRAIQRVALNEQGFSSTLAMSLKHIDSLDWVFNVTTQVDRLDGKHGIHSHRSK